MAEETWRSVDSFKDVYEVSNFGRVRSLPRVIFVRHDLCRRLSGKVLRQSIWRHESNTTVSVVLSHEARRETKSVADLVMGAFEGEKPVGYRTRHRDGDSTNNVVANLYYEPGISLAVAREIRREMSLGIPAKVLAARFNISLVTIYHTNGKRNTEESFQKRKTLQKRAMEQKNSRRRDILEQTVGLCPAPKTS